MFNEVEKSRRRVETRELGCDVSCDYILPDYLGEVRRILFTEAECIPLPAYVNGESAYLSGAVRFKMVYSDAENRLSCACFSADYDMSENYGDGLFAVSDKSAVASYSMRLLGPRKISAKARVRSVLTSVSEASDTLCGDAMTLYEPELSYATVSVRESVIREAAEREYAEEIVFLEGAISDEVEIPYERAVSSVYECHAREGEIRVSGEHTVSVIIKRPDEPAFTVKKAIPFSESFALEGAREDMSAFAEARVLSLKISENPTDTGVSVTAALIVEYCVFAEGNREVSLVCDGYLKEREVKTSYDTTSVERLLAASSERESAEFSVSLESLALSGAREILLPVAEVYVKGVEPADTAINIVAEVRFSGIACEINDDLTVSYHPLKYSGEKTFALPRVLWDADAIRPEVYASVVSADAIIEEDTLRLTAALVIESHLYGREEVRVLSSLVATEEEIAPIPKNKVYVYYPDAEDTLFDVARKFHTTAERIAIDNALTESAFAKRGERDSLASVERLIIK